jgi:hypothetical protein
MENMMEYLLAMNSSLPITLGRMFKQPLAPKYMTGGPGADYLNLFFLIPLNAILCIQVICSLGNPFEE